MLRADIIELVHELTERKAEKILDMNALLNAVCQDICKRGRHWWRRADVTFQISIAGGTTYDLTNPALFTPNLTDIAVEEISSIILVLQASPLQTTELTPIFDPAGIIAMKNNVTQAQPSRYMIDPNTWSSLRIDPPDTTYLAEMTFWAMPNLGKESVSPNVPIIPPFYHNIIVEGLEKTIAKRVYGPDDARYLSAKESYESSILTMMMRPRFSPNYSNRWVTDESATRSTSPNSP
jgi:hypothetical protein